jgi:endonuclease G
MARLPYVVPYDPDFLGDGFRVPLLTPVCQGRLVQSGRVFDYIHYSLVMHRERQSAVYAAHNIDVSQRRSVPRTGWDLDARIERAQQTGPAAYHSNPWDRGHLVRRAAVAWGTRQEAEDASDSTFYYTNAAPQHERFNQDEWLALEDWVLQSAGHLSARLCVFTGPLYTTMDTFHEGTRIPSAFWKVVVLRDPTANGNDLSALGFVMKQNELWEDWNGASTLDLRLYQVGITEIGGYTGIEFGELALLDEFEWRQPRFRDRTHMQLVEITGPDDIRFYGERRRARGIRALRVGREGSLPASTDRAAGRSRPCGGCKDAAAGDASIVALAAQVRSLEEVVETLLEDSAQRGPERAAVREARQMFARIVGGDRTQPDDFPDCACIGDDGDWFCSGVLVHERVVLTAAHCAPAIDRVYLGGTSINLVGVLGEVIPVEDVVIHPDYDPERVPSHDIAALILASPAQTAPVDLATADEVDGEDNVMLVGFGYEHPWLPLGFGTKRQVDVPLTHLAGLSEDQIAQVEWTHGFDRDHEFHAGRKELGQDSCNGDSGGPAYVRVDSAYKLAGLTSRAAHSSVLPCGDGGIYTRITPYLAWLAQATGGLLGDVDDAGPVAAPGVYISASLPNPSGRDRGNEWIEVINASSRAVPLDGYVLADKQGGQHALVGVLSAGATRRVALPASSPLKLGNRGDEISLQRDGEELHRVSYESAGTGQVLQFEHPEPEPEDPCDRPPALPGADPC